MEIMIVVKVIYDYTFHHRNELQNLLELKKVW